MTLAAFAAERRRRSTAPAAHPQLSIDISYPHQAEQSRGPPLLLTIDGTDGQTDGRPTVTWTLLRILRGRRQKDVAYQTAVAPTRTGISPLSGGR